VCGRYVNSAASEDLIDEFDVEEVLDEDVPPSWNIAPTDPVRAIVQRLPRGADKPAPAEKGNASTHRRQLRTVRWGLVPSWAKDRKIGARLINARHETVTEKPAFKSAAARRRCLLPAGGYFEWQNTASGKVPYFLHADDGELLAFAGLYEVWRDKSLPEDDPGHWLWTCTVITQQATDLVGDIHDRSPVIVPAAMRAAWLDCSADDPLVARRLLDEMPEPHLEPYVVSSEVNSVKNNGPQLIDPVSSMSQVQPQDLS
jgi:putative SOS response-associated peptidase YedK